MPIAPSPTAGPARNRRIVLDTAALAYARPADPGSSGRFALQLDRLRLAAGEAVGIAGPSGCGKSTLLDLLALLRRPESAGHHRMLDESMTALWQRGAAACTAWRAVHIGVVLQSGGLLPGLSVIENVRLPQRLLGRHEPGLVDELLVALDIHALGRRAPARLSTGQRQRVAIARALAHRPALVLADEPTAALGIEHAPAALDALIRLTRRSDAALIVVSHDHALLESRGLPLYRAAVVEGCIHWRQP